MGEKEAVEILKGRGMTEEEAKEFIEGCKRGVKAFEEENIIHWDKVKKELGIGIECNSCGAELTGILARHDYSISLHQETSRWGKGDGDVVYACAACLQELSTHDIEDILRQVDEL